jgi:lysozyme family protein
MAQYAFESVRDDYTAWWSQMTVTKVAEANAQAQAIIKDKARLKALEPRVKVPWFVVGCLLMREAGMTHDGRLHFDVWLHNGDPMHNSKGQPIRTVHKPANRPPNPNCTFEDGAYDALVVVEHLDLITDWGPERVAYAMEKFNGFGYRAPTRNIPSPYLVGGTSVQKRGKFTSDSHYDPDVMDPQIGGLAVLKQLMALDLDARFVVDTNGPSAGSAADCHRQARCPGGTADLAARGGHRQRGQTARQVKNRVGRHRRLSQRHRIDGRRPATQFE